MNGAVFSDGALGPTVGRFAYRVRTGGSARTTRFKSIVIPARSTDFAVVAGVVNAAFHTIVYRTPIEFATKRISGIFLLRSAVPRYRYKE
jgi:hypothetical protein